MQHTDRLQHLSAALQAFADERDWQQFHTPKNLAMALSVEVAELQEPFQWLTPEESSSLPAEKLLEVRNEIGDVFIYLIRLADQLGIDLLKAAEDKLELNKAKYPAEQVRGKAKKYTEYNR